ncbi:MAG: zinc metalloprotease HtpX [Selenomonadaceae bacterium]|nr:zinc metalloprotease HtpX [Selenomonadaceae bacterium]
MNTFKTAMLMALMIAIMVTVGQLVGGQTGAMVMLLISVGINFFTYWKSDAMVLRMYNAREISESEAPQLYNLVKNLAQKAELPMPRVCVIESDAPNAFATGRNPEHAAVAVTTGIMRALDYNELSGVLGHELAHVKHRDILIGTIAAAMAGVISMIGSIVQWGAIFGSRDDDDNGGLVGTLAAIIIAPLAASIIQMAISRSREYDADKTGAEICGNPNYLASALQKIENYTQHSAPLENAGEATAHMFIINPFDGTKKFLKGLFSTHPDTEDRIARLHQQATEMGLVRI